MEETQRPSPGELAGCFGSSEQPVGIALVTGDKAGQCQLHAPTATEPGLVTGQPTVEVAADAGAASRAPDH